MSQKLRVLHVYRTYFPDTQGGLEEVIRQICQNTVALNVESRVFMLSGHPQPPVLQREEAQVYRFHRTLEVASCGIGIGSFAGFKRLTAWADVIHYHFPWPFADMLHLATMSCKPSLVTYHSDVVRQRVLLWFYRPLMRKFLDSVNIIVPTSHNYFASSMELACYSDKIDVVPIGLDQGAYPEVSPEELLSVKQQVGQGFFLFVGVLRYYKGLHILLDALHDTSLRCVIVGSGPVESELKKQAKRLGLANVQFLGYVSDSVKVALYQLCRAVVFPSHLRSEAFGVTLIEGAMYGKPLISAEIGTGTSYINADGETGLVVPPEDVKSLREAMLRLEYDDSLVARFGRSARARYETLFTGKLMAERYVALYKRLSDKHCE